MTRAIVFHEAIDKLYKHKEAENKAYMNAIRKDLANPELLGSYPVQEWWKKYDRALERMNRYRAKFARIACTSTITSDLILSLYDVVGSYSKDTFIKVLNAMDIEVV